MVPEIFMKQIAKLENTRGQHIFFSEIWLFFLQNKLYHISIERVFDTDYKDSSYIFIGAIGGKEC